LKICPSALAPRQSPGSRFRLTGVPVLTNYLCESERFEAVRTSLTTPVVPIVITRGRASYRVVGRQISVTEVNEDLSYGQDGVNDAVPMRRAHVTESRLAGSRRQVPARIFSKPGATSVYHGPRNPLMPTYILGGVADEGCGPRMRSPMTGVTHVDQGVPVTVCDLRVQTGCLDVSNVFSLHQRFPTPLFHPG
jgi:hypothetical protein